MTNQSASDHLRYLDPQSRHNRRYITLKGATLALVLLVGAFVSAIFTRQAQVNAERGKPIISPSYTGFQTCGKGAGDCTSYGHPVSV